MRMRTFPSIVGASFVAVAIGCAMLIPSASFAQAAREAREVLTLEQARERAARVSDVRYTVMLELDGTSPEFSGVVRGRFRLGDGPTADLTLDFSGGTVRDLVVNGNLVDVDYNGFYITLPGDLLASGENEVEVAFSHPYSRDGSGLYRFEDPEDGRHYLYTDFEPYHQNRLFPSFDQPDLKARYTTRVVVPADWQVIANVRETDGGEVSPDGQWRIWNFPETPPLSTYVYALHAGDYHVWEADADGIPLRLFARESLVPYIHTEHWFEPTQQGFAFYQEYFGVDYPFVKYDQVIVPHFNAGAMENVAAVTFSERYLRRGVVTRQDRRALASVILHEMAHMWFGDLVTMDWWNGLWLNESFATYMATLAMANGTEFTDEWLSAFRSKTGAYDADQRDTTHPIELPTPDTDAAFANFDAITYNKGSAVLTQLSQFVGPEAFRRGVGRYLETHAWGNTTIQDFFDAISEAAGRDLDAWARDWLDAPGTNTVEASFVCDGDELRSVTLRQGAPEAWPVLREHRAQLGLYRFAAGRVTIDALPVSYEGSGTTVDVTDLPCPDMIYANHGDWDFVRVRLDARDVERVRTRLDDFDDPLARAMLWRSLYDLVLDAGLAPGDLIEIGLGIIGDEPVDAVANQITNGIQGALGLFASAAPRSLEFESAQSQVEEAFWREASAAAPGSDRQLMYFDAFVAAAASFDSRARLERMLEDPGTVPAGITLDQDRRWTLLTRLAGFGDADVPGLLAAERAADPSDNGRLRAISVTAALPDAAQQRELMETLLAPSADFTVAEGRAIADGLFPRGQEALERPVALETLRRLPDVNAAVDPIHFDAIIDGLLGALCEDGYLDALDESIGVSGDWHPTLQKTLLDLRFDVRRCLKIAATL
jgi:aminopeptidase N